MIWTKVGVLLSTAIQDLSGKVDTLFDDKKFYLPSLRGIPAGQAAIPSGQVMQSSAFDPVNQQWFVTSPTGSSPETLRVHRLTPAGALIDTMTLTGAGHGYQISVQIISGVQHIWLTWQDPPTGSTYPYSLVSFPYAPWTTIDRNDASITLHQTLEDPGLFIVVAHDWANGYAASRVGGNPLRYTRRRIADMDAGIDQIVGAVDAGDPAARQYQGHATLGDYLYVLTGTSSSDRLIWVYSWTDGQLVDTVDVGDMGLNPDGTSPGPCEPEGINSVTDPTTGLSSIVVGVAAGSAPRANLIYQYAQHGQANFATLGSGQPVSDQNYRLVGNPGEAPFEGSWVNLSPSYHSAGYRMLSSGLVVLNGYVKGGARGETIFYLPPGYRPPFTIRSLVFMKDAGDAHPGLAMITPTGAIYLSSDSINGTGTISWIDLSPIYFTPN